MTDEQLMQQMRERIQQEQAVQQASQQAQSQTTSNTLTSQTGSGFNNTSFSAPASEPELSTSTIMIDNAIKAAQLLKDENDRKERLLRLEQEIRSKAILGGRGEVNQAPQLSKEEQTKKDVNAWLRGTGLSI